jgi:membrane protein implicated in regulation of membrane protease activity
MDVAFWLIWIAIAILALVGELLTLGLFFASLSLAALFAAAASLVLPVPPQIVVFCILALLMLFAARPAVLRVLPLGTATEETPTIGPVGHHALVSEPISNLQGQIRVGSGEFWSARPEQPSEPIEQGREVEVVRMEGLTAVVRPVSAVDHSTEDASEAGTPFGLSAREIDVLQLVARGMSNAEIAERLVLS